MAVPLLYEVLVDGCSYTMVYPLMNRVLMLLLFHSWTKYLHNGYSTDEHSTNTMVGLLMNRVLAQWFIL